MMVEKMEGMMKELMKERMVGTVMRMRKVTVGVMG